MTLFTLVILGAGQTGQVCATYGLLQGWKVILCDEHRVWQPDAATEAKGSFECYTSEQLPQTVLEAADSVVVSPGIPLHHPWLKDLHQWGIAYTSDTAFFTHKTDATIVGVTGTNGKSTVCVLLKHVAQHLGYRAFAGGNLGPPALSLLSEPADLYILELSSFQLTYSADYQVDVGVVLNIGDDHADWHGDLAHYRASKLDLLRHTKHGIAPTALLPFAKAHDYDRFFDQARACVDLSPAILPFENLAACMAVGEALGWPEDVWQAALPTFKGLPHRLQKVDVASSHHWYNDSKGTNFDAAAFAARWLHRSDDAPFWWLCGGQLKSLDISCMQPWLQSAIKGIVIFGPVADKMQQVFEEIQFEGSIFATKSMEEAVQMVAQKAEVGERILLSPGGSSFDAYPNYQVRGEVFEQWVRRVSGDGDA